MQRTKTRSLLISVLLALSFLSQIPINTVVAATPVVNHAANNFCSTGATCTTGSLAITTAGDIVIVVIPAYKIAVGSDATPITAVTSAGQVLTFQSEAQQVNVHDTASGLWLTNEVWEATTTSTTALTVSVTIATSGAYSWAVEAYDVSNLGGPSAIGSATGSCTSNCANAVDNIHTSASVGFTLASGQFPVYSVIDDSNANAWSADANWVATSFNTKFNNVAYSLSAIPANPTTFPSSSGQGACATNPCAWAVLGVVFGTSATVVTVVGSCTFFQLQCWWYPLFFMMLYGGILMWVATTLKTSPRGKAHIFLSAITFGSLIAVILGIMNIVFPLLMLVINTIIALRLRG